MKRNKMIALRERAGLTRADVAKRLWCSEERIKSIEYGHSLNNGRTSTHERTWHQLSVLYNCKPEDFED